MINAVKRVGVPVILQKYTRKLYSGTTKRLKVGLGGQLSGVVHVKRCVTERSLVSITGFGLHIVQTPEPYTT